MKRSTRNYLRDCLPILEYLVCRLPVHTSRASSEVSVCMCSGLGLEEEVPDYDLDSEDEEWLSAQTKERVRETSLYSS